MATRKIAMKYDLCQNNITDSTANGKWYPRAVRDNTLNLKGLANHIQGHGSVYTRDVVEGVILKFKDCIIELVSQGVGVKLDGLGTFYPTLEAEGADSPIGYNVLNCLKGVHIRFNPENAADERITSRAMTEKVALKQNMIYDRDGKPKMVKDEQLVDYVRGNKSNDNGGDDNQG